MINRILELLQGSKQLARKDFEIARECENELAIQYHFGQLNAYNDIEVIIQQVANEHGKTLNRCDTCTHYTSEEIVPPICYFCCKGMEDNYKAREGE